MNKCIFILAILFIGSIFVFPSLVSAGLGIGYSSQSFMAHEGQKFCLNYYKVYNPWDDDSYVTVDVSEELQGIMVKQDTEALFVPAQTSSDEAISLDQFCFKVPQVYNRDYKIAEWLINRLDCEGPHVEYSGEIVISNAPAPMDASGGAGGSATKSSISAPLTIRVACEPHSWDYSMVYLIIAVLAAIVVLGVLVKRYRKPKAQRDMEKLEKLKAEVAREKGSKKKNVEKKGSKKKSK